MEQIAYLREAKSLPAIEAQMAALRAAGVTGLDVTKDRAYLDAQPKRRAAEVALTERARAIQACRAGDELWVASPAILGASVDDALLALEEITKRGAVLRIASTGAAYSWHPGAAEAVALAREIGEEVRKARTSKAGFAARARQARTREQEKASWDRARKMWLDAERTVREITEATGIRPRTLYNAAGRGELPPRNVQPFTGGPKAKMRGK